MDAFMKEIGVGMAMRMMAKGMKPRLVISENGDRWTIRSESSLKTTSLEFTPGVEFNDTTADGREVKVLLSSLSNNCFYLIIFRQLFNLKMVRLNTRHVTNMEKNG